MIAAVNRIQHSLSLVSVQQSLYGIANRLVEIVGEEDFPGVSENIELSESVIFEANLVSMHLSPGQQGCISKASQRIDQELSCSIRVKPESRRSKFGKVRVFRFRHAGRYRVRRAA